MSGPTGGEPFALQPGDSHQPNPFWMVSATKDVIDGHGGIWQDPLQRFLASLVFKHVELTARNAAHMMGASAPGASASVDLAAYARTLARF